MKAPVSVVILTFNEEKNIQAALTSVAGWAAEVIVVDSGSSDQTVEIARRYADQVVQHPYVDHASQWSWILACLPLRSEWVLALDADNVVSEKLKFEIGAALEQEQADVAGYYAIHNHHFRNKPVRGLKKYWLRLVRRDSTRVDLSELVDFRFLVDGSTRILAGDIIESNQNELSINFWIDKHQRFADRMAAEEVLRRAGRLAWTMSPRLLGNSDERMLWLKQRWYRFPLYVRPFLYFLYRYIGRGGFLDGSNGVVYHTLQALWFRLLVDLRIAEIEESVASGTLTLAELEATVR